MFYYPVVMNGFCYWWSQTNSSYDLYKSDGRTTTLIGDLASMGLYAHWTHPVVIGDKIVFSGNFTGKGLEPGVSDGTIKGTGILKDIVVGSGSGHCFYPQALNGKVYFRADEGTGFGLWVTDGTTMGTGLLKACVYLNKDPVVGGDKLYFGGISGFWVTDGTTAGTKCISVSSQFSAPAAFQGKIYFYGSSAAGDGLWVTDGTTQGTKLVFDPEPGNPFNYLNDITPVGSRYFFFRMKTGNYGREGFVSDGTSAGTRMMWDAQPGNLDGRFDSPCHAGNGLLLVFIDDVHKGKELFAIDPGASVLSYGVGHGPVVVADDPVLGTVMNISLRYQPASTAAVILFGQPTGWPQVFGNSPFFFNLMGFIYGVFPISGAGSNLSIPNISALTGAQLAVQGFYAPGPGVLGLGFTQGLVLTFGQ